MAEWTPERKAAQSAMMKERHAKSGEAANPPSAPSANSFSDEQKAAAKVAFAEQRIETKRVPMGSSRGILPVHDTPEGYVDRWVKADPGRIEKALQSGREFVRDASVGDRTVDRGSSVGAIVHNENDGTPLYLMRIPKEYFDEDQKAKQEKVDRLEEGLRRPKTKQWGDFESESSISSGRLK